MADRMRELMGSEIRRDRPSETHGKDWNEQLKSLRAEHRVEPEQLDQLLHKVIDPKAELKVIAKGLPASPGAATGQAVFDADTAAARGGKGEKVILVRQETNPDDIHGMEIGRAHV